MRAAGVGHSPSDLACTEEFMVVMTGMRAILEVIVLGPASYRNSLMERCDA